MRCFRIGSGETRTSAVRQTAFRQALAFAAAAFTASSLTYATPTVDESLCQWHEASFWSHTEPAASRIAACLKHGADPDARDRFQRTVAFHAARANAPAALAVLARHGATLDLATPSGKTPLHAAAGAGARESAAWLVRAGLDPTVTDHFGQTPGRYAKNMGHLVLGNHLEALPSPRRCAWMTESFWAPGLAFETAASRLAACLKHGTNPDARDRFQRTVAFHAARANAPAALAVLARHGATLDLATPSGKTPLHAAAGAGARESAAWLVRAGLDPTVTDHFGQTPGRYAKNMGHLVLGKRLQTLPSPRRCAWMTESFWALGLALEDALEACHSQGYRAIGTAPDGTTATHLAARLRPEETQALRKLVEMGASPTQRDDADVTPAHILAMIDGTPALKVLIAEGGEIHRPNIDGHYPIDLAAAMGSSANVQVLIEAGADITRTNIRGLRPIHYAAAGNTEGHLEARRIIEAAMPKETKRIVEARAPESPAPPPAAECSDRKRIETAAKNITASALATCVVGAAISWLDFGLTASVACTSLAATATVVVVADAIENERCETAVIAVGKGKF